MCVKVWKPVWVSVHTCQAERFKAKLGAVQDDEAVSLVQPCCRVLNIALKVPGLLSRTDLLDLSNVNWEDRRKQLAKQGTIISLHKQRSPQ